MRYLLAIYLLIWSIQLTAQHRVSYFERGRTALINERYTEAIEYLSYAVDQTNFYEAFFLRGIVKTELGDTRGAENDYTQCINQAPYHKDAIFYRAMVRNQQYKYELAFQDFNKAQKLDSTNWRIYLYRSTTHLNMQNFNAAIKDCNKAIKLNYKGEAALVIRGMANTGLKEYGTALVDFNRAIQLFPKNINARLHRGICYGQMQQLDSAMQNFEWILRQDSVNVQALLQRATIRMAKQEYVKALTDLNRSINLSPNYLKAIFQRAILKNEIKDYSSAVEDYDQIIKKKPNNIHAYFNRALIKQTTGDLHGALSDYDKIIEIHPEYADAYSNRSLIKKRLKDFEGAERDQQLAHDLNMPKNIEGNILTIDKKAKIMKITSLSAPDLDNNSRNGKVQYNHLDITVKPYYLLATSNEYDKKLHFYDALKKENYAWDLVGLAPATSSLEDARIQQEIDSLEGLSHRQDLDVNYYLKKANLYTYVEECNKAFEAFNQAIFLDKNNILGYFGRANVKLKCRELLNEFEPSDNRPLINGGISYDAAPEIDDEYSYENIIKDYDKTISLDETFTYAYFNRSYLKSKMGNFHSSIIDLTKTIELKPQFSEAYFNRGLTYVYMGNNSEGCKDLGKAGELGLEEAYNVILRYCSQ